MRIVKSQQDFDILRRARALTTAFLDLIEDYFLQLMVELKDEDAGEFRLGMNGYFVVLEAGDNLRDLGNVGLNRKTHSCHSARCGEPIDRTVAIIHYSR